MHYKNRHKRLLPREEAKVIAVNLKKEGVDNDAIAKFLHEEHEYSNTRGGEIRPYSGAHIGTLIKESLTDLREQNLEGAKEYATLLEMRYEKLYSQWEPKSDKDLKAAEFCKKVLNDLATLKGANAPVEMMINHKVEQSFETVVAVLREKLPDSTFIEVINALDSVQQDLNMHYEAYREHFKEQKALESENVVDVDVIED